MRRGAVAQATDPRLEMLGLGAQERRSISGAAVDINLPYRHNSRRIIQSTNHHRGVTNDTIAHMFDTSRQTLDITHGGGGAGDWMVRATNFVPPGEGGETSDWFFSAHAGGTVYAFVTVKSAIAGEEGDDFRDSIGTGDYLAAGIWAYAPADRSAADGFDLGAFAASSHGFLVQNEITAGEDNAVFAGDAFGFLLGADSLFSFTGGVSLTANFAAGFISGGIGNIRNAHDNAPVGMRLDLNAGVMNAAGEDGFFAGALSARDSANDAYKDISGSWGGNFAAPNDNAGDIPSHALGTFGGKDGSGGDVLIGVFTAEHRAP